MKKVCGFLIMCILASIAISTTVYANSAEPPNFTVVVPFAPDDLTLKVRYSDGEIKETAKVRHDEIATSKKAWEKYYSFRIYKPTNGAVIIASTSDKYLEFEYPQTSYNGYAILDFNNETLTVKYNIIRQLVLIFMRIIITLVVEGYIFWLFDYREKRSWRIFFILNLITQGFLNISFSSPLYGAYWIFIFIFVEIIIFATEIAVYGNSLTEHNKSTAVSYAFTANILSLIIGAILIGYLPT